MVNRAGGVSISVPKAWKQRPAQGGLGELRMRVNYVADGRATWGITVSSSKQDSTLKRASSAAETKPLQALAKRTLSVIPAVSSLKVTSSDALPTGFAALVSYDVQAAGSPAYSVRSYWLVAGGRMYVLAGATPKGQMQAHAATFRRIFQTFRPI